MLAGHGGPVPVGDHLGSDVVGALVDVHPIVRRIAVDDSSDAVVPVGTHPEVGEQVSLPSVDLPSVAGELDRVELLNECGEAATDFDRRKLVVVADEDDLRPGGAAQVE